MTKLCLFWNVQLLNLVLVDGRLVPHLVGGGDGGVGVGRESLGGGDRRGPDTGESVLGLAGWRPNMRSGH